LGSFEHVPASGGWLGGAGGFDFGGGYEGFDGVGLVAVLADEFGAELGRSVLVGVVGQRDASGGESIGDAMRRAAGEQVGGRPDEVEQDQAGSGEDLGGGHSG
jgi:hypothetical protein